MSRLHNARRDTVAFGWSRPLFHFLSVIYISSIYGLPLVLMLLIGRAVEHSWWKWPALTVSPIFYAAAMAMVGGLFSVPHQRGIIRGTFPRNLECRIYFHRRLYGLCWTTLFYCKPVYSICLAIPTLKWLTFRIFGYRGTLDFAIYPDTWIRDLPLLKLGKGSYISNRATLGTNIALINGRILVDQISIDEGACVGHLSMLAPGVHVEKFAEIGVGCGLGIGTQIGEGATVGPECTIEHGLLIGAHVKIGTMSFIGTRTKIADGLCVPAGSLIPARQTLVSQSDTANYVSAKTRTSLKPIKLAIQTESIAEIDSQSV